MIRWAALIAALLASSSAGAQCLGFQCPPGVLGAGTSGAPGPLDAFTTPSGAYSFRKLKSSYSGPAIRIRRASDNAETDINFLGCTSFTGCPWDSAAATAHCAATSCFVVTWYDQSGLVRHLTQATAANQPSLVFGCNGVLPCMRTTANTFNLSSAASITPATGVVSFSVVANRSSAATGFCTWLRQNGVNNRISTNSVLNQWALVGGTSGSVLPTAADLAWHSVQGVVNGASSSMMVDGTTTTGTTTGNTVAGTAQINGAVGTTCDFAEAVDWDNYVLTPAERAALTNNQKSFWGHTMRRLAAALAALLLLRADMYQDAGNAKLPEAQQNLGIVPGVGAAQYGVRGDRADVVADMTVGAGGTAATTAATTFTAADVGKFLLVYGAGTAGRVLSTSVAAVTGPHSVTLGNAAITAVSNAGFEYGSDPHDGLQAAINAAEAQGGGRVVIPPGKYIMKAQRRVNLKHNVTLDGENGAEIRCDDTVNAGNPYDNSCIFSTGQNNVTVQNFRVKGMLDLDPTPNVTLSGPVLLSSGDNITMTGMDIGWTRSNAALFWSNKRVMVTLNRIHNVLWAGIDVAAAETSIVSFNEISYCNDNPIAIGTGDNTSGLTSPQSNTSVIGNIITECWSTALSGVKNATFANNLVKRSAHQALFVAPYTNFANGNTAMVSVNVTNNVFLDLITTTPPGQSPPATPAYIVLNGAQRKAGSLASVPGYPASGTGTVTDLYGTGIGRYWTLDTDAAAVASPGGGGWNVSGNVMMRTLPAVAAATDWGYGGLWNGMRTTAAVPYAGPVTEAELNVNCITITGPLRNARISGNICNTTGDYGILFDTLSGVYAPANGDYDGLTISDNKFTDYKTAGIFINPTAAFYSQAIVAGNEFNADPRFLHSNRGAGGTWATAAAPHGINNQKLSGLLVDNNHFRNLTIPISAGSTLMTTGPNNTIYGAPAADGFSTGNVGVGSVSGATGVQGRYRLVHEDGNPASATFGKQMTSGGQTFATIPTTGTWLTGTMVWKQAPTLEGDGRALLGWMRLTTGSANVAGTDWKIVYSAP